ncbi:hypothetical protein IC582_019711 [Cucumis melo]
MEKYEFIKELGAGSFGVANLCRDKKRGELVAIKFIERGPTIDENVEREIVNHRLLQHPNVIYFKEVFLTPTHLGLVMEYASGGELFEKIRNQRRPFTEDEARYLFRQLILGVQYIHSMDICHRDLKLDNILLDNGSKSPRLKICDFGYSKRVNPRELKQIARGRNFGSGFPKRRGYRDLKVDSNLSYGCQLPQLNQKCNSVGSNSASQSKINNNFGFYKFHSKPNTNVGSATYTAPEVLRGGEYDGKMADVWSCAVTLYVMLVAAYPFDDSEDSENSGKTIKRIMSGDYKIPDHIHLSEGCQHLLSRMFIPDPSMRISIKKITTHSWFSNNLQSKQTEPTLELDNPNFSHQSVKEIRNIVIEARNQLAP